MINYPITLTYESAIQAYAGVKLFDLDTATKLTESMALDSLPGVSSFTQYVTLLAISEPAKKIFLAKNSGDQDGVLEFSYTDIADLSTGVAYVREVQLATSDPAITAIYALVFTADGMDAYAAVNSSEIGHLSLSSAYDLATATLVDSLSVADIVAASSRTGSAYTSILTGRLGLKGNTIYTVARIGNTGSNYWLATIPLNGDGTVTGCGIAEAFDGGVSDYLPNPGVTFTATQRGNALTNPRNAHVYMLDPNAADDVLVYDNFSLLTGRDVSADFPSIDRPLGGYDISPDGSKVIFFKNSSGKLTTLAAPTANTATVSAGVSDFCGFAETLEIATAVGGAGDTVLVFAWAEGANSLGGQTTPWESIFVNSNWGGTGQRVGLYKQIARTGALTPADIVTGTGSKVRVACSFVINGVRGNHFSVTGTTGAPGGAFARVVAATTAPFSNTTRIVICVQTGLAPSAPVLSGVDADRYSTVMSFSSNYGTSDDTHVFVYSALFDAGETIEELTLSGSAGDAGVLAVSMGV